VEGIFQDYAPPGPAPVRNLISLDGRNPDNVPMRRQTLLMIPGLLVALTVYAFIGLQATQGRQAHLHPAQWRREAVQGLSLDLPAETSSAIQMPGEPWTATEFRSGVLGTFRVARERPRGDFQGALREWFELPGPLDQPLTYRLRGEPAQARPVVVFGPGAHVVRRQRRLLVAVCVFDLDGWRYWVQSRVRDGGREHLEAFDRILASMRASGGSGVDALLPPALAEAEAALAPGLVQNPVWVIALPGVAMILAMGLALGIGRLSGRPPRDPGALAASYLVSGVEVLMGGRFQRKYFDAALAVLGDQLVLYTFGTPFLSVPLAHLRGRITEGTSWFGPPYLEFTLEGAADFRKHKLLYGLWSKGTRLRLHTDDPSRLRIALGA